MIKEKSVCIAVTPLKCYMLLLILTFPEELKAIVTNFVPITYRTKVISILRENPQTPPATRKAPPTKTNQLPPPPSAIFRSLKKGGGELVRFAKN